ncbi:MAG: hypothetical protein ACYDBB_18110 [Armatimonadota bacterium]
MIKCLPMMDNDLIYQYNYENPDKWIFWTTLVFVIGMCVIAAVDNEFFESSSASLFWVGLLLICSLIWRQISRLSAMRGIDISADGQLVIRYLCKLKEIAVSSITMIEKPLMSNEIRIHLTGDEQITIEPYQGIDEFFQALKTVNPQLEFVNLEEYLPEQAYPAAE